MSFARSTKGKGKNYLVGLGLAAFVGLCASYPIYYVTHGPKPSQKDKLSGEAIVRGAYINAGSKDIGLDPKAGTYKT